MKTRCLFCLFLRFDCWHDKRGRISAESRASGAFSSYKISQNSAAWAIYRVTLLTCAGKSDQKKWNLHADVQFLNPLAA
jgi:hypothetical protein